MPRDSRGRDQFSLAREKIKKIQNNKTKYGETRKGRVTYSSSSRTGLDWEEEEPTWSVRVSCELVCHNLATFHGPSNWVNNEGGSLSSRERERERLLQFCLPLVTHSACLPSVFYFFGLFLKLRVWLYFRPSRESQSRTY
jgi:hypothetical protein